MKKKTTYRSPLVLRLVSLKMETSILAGSVVDYVSEISTTGQDVNDVIDTGSDTFNHVWR